MIGAAPGCASRFYRPRPRTRPRGIREGTEIAEAVPAHCGRHGPTVTILVQGLAGRSKLRRQQAGGSGILLPSSSFCASRELLGSEG